MVGGGGVSCTYQNSFPCNTFCIIVASVVSSIACKLRHIVILGNAKDCG